MNILVTGGAGFIASHIADAYIALGHNVIVLDNLSTGFKRNVPTKAKFFELDVTDEQAVNDLMRAERIDIVNHHAAQMNVRFSVESPKEDAITNILGGLNVYEAARKNGVKKVIFASSGGAIYGDTKNIPTPETEQLEPCSPYGIAKLANEKYLAFYKETYGMDFVCLRYANIYGPRQNAKGEAGVVAIFANKILRNEQPVINGDGNNTRDYVYVKDVVKANVFALEDDCSGIYNIGTEIETSTNQIFHLLNTLLGMQAQEVHGEAKMGEQRVSCISSEKLHNEFGWKPQTLLSEGLKETIQYFKEQVI